MGGPPILTSVSDHGFYAAAYRDGATGKIVVAFRGTDGLNDVGADAALAFGGWHPQFDEAINFLRNLAEQQYSKQANPLESLQGNVLVTGHSLGGALAQLTAQLYGLDGAAFDPAGAFRQTTLPEYRVTAERLGIDVSQNQIPDSFRNYHVEGSMVPDGTGAHLGTVREIPPFATVGIGDVLQGALVG